MALVVLISVAHKSPEFQSFYSYLKKCFFFGGGVGGVGGKGTDKDTDTGFIVLLK